MTPLPIRLAKPPVYPTNGELANPNWRYSSHPTVLVPKASTQPR